MTQARFFVVLIVFVVLIAPVIPFLFGCAYILLFGCACILLFTMGPIVALFVIQSCFNNLLRSRRDVFLIRYRSPHFPSHWVIFVPNRAGHHINGKNAGPGKVIHVEGDVNIGFNLLFKRNYDPLQSLKTMEVVFLASINNALVVDPTDSLTFYPEEGQALPGDKLEQIALSVLAPDKTLGVRASSLGTHIFRFADDFSFQDAKGKPINHDCQWWTKEYVRTLVAAGVMPTEALAILDNIPQNL
jgi:hypothetical protein